MAPESKTRLPVGAFGRVSSTTRVAVPGLNKTVGGILCLRDVYQLVTDPFIYRWVAVVDKSVNIIRR